MRNNKNTLKSSLFSLIVASSLAFPAFVGAQSAQPTPSNASQTRTPTASPGKAITGKVSGKSSSSLTVDGASYAVNDSTKFTKGGQAIKLDDIQVGDEVRITLAAESAMQAASVEVVSARN